MEERNATVMMAVLPLLTLSAGVSGDNFTNYTAVPENIVPRPPVLRLIVYNLDMFFVPLIIILGLIGNTISFLVFVFTRLRVLSSSIYLAALAVSDSGFLFCVFVGWLVNVKFNFYEYQGLCQVYIYLTYIFGFLSVSYVVGFTVERYIVVCFPFQRNQMCTPRRAKLVVALMAAFAAVVFSPVLSISIVETYSGVRRCHTKPGFEIVAQVMNYIDTVITLIVPSLTIVIINTRIMRLVMTIRNQQKRDLTLALSNTSNSSSQRRNSLYRRGSSVQVTRLLLVVSTMFLVLNLPAHAMRLHMSITEIITPGFKPSVNYQQCMKLFQYIYYVNFSINFVLYSVCGRNFRRSMRKLFTRVPKDRTKYGLRQLN